MAQYGDKRVPLMTVMWPGQERCREDPLRGIFHSAHDGTPQFEFSGSVVASDESAFPEFLYEFAEALRAYQVKSVTEEIEAAEAKRRTSSGRKRVSSQTKKGRVLKWPTQSEA